MTNYIEKTNIPVFKTIEEMFEFYAGIAFEKQYLFLNAAGDNFKWGVDLEKGEISFGKELVCSLQILGTFAFTPQTWLWGWANSSSPIPQNILNQSLILKKYGEDNNIETLKEAEYKINDQNKLHMLGMIASGMFDSTCYYLANYGQGLMCATAKSDKIIADSENKVNSVLIYMQVISQFEVNQRNVFVNYFNMKGYEIIEKENKLTAVKDKENIESEFDSLSRMSNISVKMRG